MDNPNSDWPEHSWPELTQFDTDIASVRETRHAEEGQLTEHGGDYTFFLERKSWKKQTHLQCWFLLPDQDSNLDATISSWHQWAFHDPLSSSDQQTTRNNDWCIFPNPSSRWWNKRRILNSIKSCHLSPRNIRKFLAISMLEWTGLSAMEGNTWKGRDGKSKFKWNLFPKHVFRTWFHHHKLPVPSKQQVEDIMDASPLKTLVPDWLHYSACLGPSQPLYYQSYDQLRMTTEWI